MTRVKNKPIYQTSEIIVNSDGRILNTDQNFCEIFNCSNSASAHNSVILDFVAEKHRPTVVNAFIDTFYSSQEGKLFNVQMVDYLDNLIDVSINFFIIKSSNGQKATLLIRKKLF